MADHGDNNIKALSAGLNSALADYYTLYLKTKNFHWHVGGPHFREYHLLFDEQATQLITTTDIIAERVRKLGQETLRSIAGIVAQRSLDDDRDIKSDAKEMIAALRDDNAQLVKRLKSLKDLASAAGDNATDGLIDDWTDEAEQRIWFLEASLG